MGAVQRQNQNQRPFGEVGNWDQEGHQDDVREIPSIGDLEAAVHDDQEGVVLADLNGLQEVAARRYSPFPCLCSRSCRAEKDLPVIGMLSAAES